MIIKTSLLIEEISKMAPPERRSKVADEFLDTPIPDSNSLTVNKKNKTIFNFHFHFQKKECVHKNRKDIITAVRL